MNREIHAFERDQTAGPEGDREIPRLDECGWRGRWSRTSRLAHRDAAKELSTDFSNGNVSLKMPVATMVFIELSNVALSTVATVGTPLRFRFRAGISASMLLSPRIGATTLATSSIDVLCSQS